MARAIVQITDVTKHYRMGSEVVRALDGITLSFEQGSFWAIMGPSGSGKSTLLNILGCLDRPTSGKYILASKDVAQLDDDELSDIRLKHIGFIFQSFNLIPQLTVRQNVELPLFYLGNDEQTSAEKARKTLDLVELSDRLDHKPTELSGGQQQRVAIARSLANDPDFILADEPTGNLDTATGQQIMDLLGALNRQGKTILMVTHEKEIAEHAGHSLHMRDGKIESIRGGT